MSFFKRDPKPDADKAPTPNMAFPDIGGPDPALDEPIDTNTPDATLAAFDKFREESAEREDRMLATIASFVNNAGVNGHAPAAPVVEPKVFEAAAVPDLVDDPEGFARVVQENITGSVQHMFEAQAAESNANAATNTSYSDMWSDFTAKYEDLAPYEDLIEVNAGRIMREMRTRGVDVDQYMRQNRDKFLEDVATSVGGRLVALGIAPGSGASERHDPAKNVNRTGGLPGASNVPAEPKDGGDPAPTVGLVGEIHNIQRTMGII